MDSLQTGTQDLVGHGALAVELGCLAALAMLALWFAVRARQRGSLDVPALCAIAGLSIFWQEFYADWGAYLLWSSKFHMMPWGATAWTTPEKPWFVLPAYPLFMCAAFTAALALSRATIDKFPNVRALWLCLLTAGPALYAINFALELASVSLAGQWTYVDVIGPALTTDAGQQPILYPGIPLGLFGAVTSYLILRQDSRGHPTFERWFRPDRFATAWKRESMRALSWVLVWNLSYWLLLTMPLIAIRELFGPPSALVP